jgi:tetratricopeptide (TPR) repeat protein
MPALARLVESGASGKLATVLPTLPPIVWNSLATGATADRHGIFAAEDNDNRTGPQSRRVAALWEILSERGVRTHVIGWPYTRSPESVSGAFVHTRFATHGSPASANWPLPAGCVWPERLQDELGALRVHPSDFGGPALLPFIPRAREIDQTRNDSLSKLALALSFTCSLHNAATWVLEQQPWDFMAVYSPGIAAASRLFMRYHPPRLPDVDETSFELYHGVVTAMYRFHDMLLARLMQLAGPGATLMLVSNHGYRSGSDRAPSSRSILDDPSLSHRTYGILGIAGPDVAPDEILHGTSVLDIAPTVLALFGVPAADGMTGNVLAPAWERLEVPARASAPAEPIDAGFVDGLAHQFAGFQDVPPNAPAAELDRFHLSCVYMTTGRPSLALPILRELAESAPEESRYQLALLQCYLALGMLSDAKQVLHDLFSGQERQAYMYYFRGVVQFTEGDRAAALDSFAQAERMAPDSAFLPVLMGHCYAGNRLWAKAEASYGLALERDPDSAEAHAGMAAVALHHKRSEDAANHALTALGLRYHMPAAHFRLGTALARMGKFLEAELALQACLRMAPGQKGPRRLLAYVLARKTMAAQARW